MEITINIDSDLAAQVLRAADKAKVGEANEFEYVQTVCEWCNDSIDLQTEIANEIYYAVRDEYPNL